MSNTKTRKPNKTRNAIISILLIAALAITGIFAFLSATDSKVNTFTIGKIDIQLKENFNGGTYDKSTGDPTPIENVLPVQVTEKEPWINNNGRNPAYVYMQVAIPIIPAVLHDKDGNELNDGNVVEVEAFEPINADNEVGINDGWEPISSFEKRLGPDGKLYNYYIYGYNTELAVDGDTTPLFNSVRMVNHSTNRGEQITSADGKTKAGIMPSELKIPINAYAIQKGVYEGELSTPMTQTELTDIWNNNIVDKMFFEPGTQTTPTDPDNPSSGEDTTEPSVTFYGYIDWENEEIVHEPATLTWDEIVAGKDADKYNYGTPAILFASQMGINDAQETIKSANDNIPWYQDQISILQEKINNNTAEEWEIRNFEGYKDEINRYEKKIAKAEADIEMYEALINNTPSITNTEIPSCAFAMSSVEKVILPNTITSIGTEAFSQSFLLQKINMPNSVTTLGSGIFKYADALESCNIPTSITRIPEGMFFCCSSLKNITIPEGITEIGEEAFYNCGSLESITLPETLTTIRADAFSNIGCEIEIPDNVTIIEDGNEHTFYYCPNLICSDTVAEYEGYPWGAKNVNKFMEDGIVYSDESMTTVLAVLNSAPSEITLPESVTDINDQAFYHRDKPIKILNVPDSVETINDYMFQDVILLNYNGSVQRPAYDDDNKYWGARSLNGYVDDNGYVFSDESCTVLEGYIGEPLKETVTIPDDVEIIGRYAFSLKDIENVTSIILPDTVKVIGKDAFPHLSDIVPLPPLEITIPAGIERIGNYVFGSVSIVHYDGNDYHLDGEESERDDFLTALQNNGVLSNTKTYEWDPVKQESVYIGYAQLSNDIFDK